MVFSSRKPLAIGVLAVLVFAGLVGCRSASDSAPAARQPPTPINPALTGSIQGRVEWKGAPPAMAIIDMSGTPGCASPGQPAARDESVVVNADGGLRWAFVYIEHGLEGWSFALPAGPVMLDQKGCMFEPHVVGMMAGQKLRIVSSDSTTHNVHAEPRLNPPWNESMMPGMAPLEETFNRPEVMIPIQCNVHAWMAAYAGVVSSPYFAVTGADGGFLLRNVPAGSYTLAVWQERYGVQRRQVTVLPRQTTRVEFSYPG